MEKFNLERALAGEPVITRDGREVTQLAQFDMKQGKQCLIGVLDYDLERWTVEGNYFLNKTEAQGDLFMKPKENAVWVNIYKDIDGRLYVGRDSYCSEADAKSEGGALYNYVKTIKITE